MFGFFRVIFNDGITGLMTSEGIGPNIQYTDIFYEMIKPQGVILCEVTSGDLGDHKTGSSHQLVLVHVRFDSL
jgi:hypothetical protein